MSVLVFLVSFRGCLLLLLTICFSGYVFFLSLSLSLSLSLPPPLFFFKVCAIGLALKASSLPPILAAIFLREIRVPLPDSSNRRLLIQHFTDHMCQAVHSMKGRCNDHPTSFSNHTDKEERGNVDAPAAEKCTSRSCGASWSSNEKRIGTSRCDSMLGTHSHLPLLSDAALDWVVARTQGWAPRGLARICRHVMAKKILVASPAIAETCRADDEAGSAVIMGSAATPLLNACSKMDLGDVRKAVLASQSVARTMQGWHPRTIEPFAG